MKSIQWKMIWPHGLAVFVFLAVTIFFFNPIFFENKVLNQPDIQQFKGGYQSILDYRAVSGEEALWAPSMFSGMPAYLVSVRWSDGPMMWIKKILSLLLPHPISNIFLAFLCYYIMLLSFRVRPYLAIAGALAFGLSSYMIIGLFAGHNSRIGAIAFMPLVIAGIHLTFSGKRILGFGLTAMALALHLRENHLQITYYLVMVVGLYGLVQFIYAVRAKRVADFFKTLGILIPAAILAVATFFGQLWAIQEYTPYSIRGPSELVTQNAKMNVSGLTKEHAFAYRYGVTESMVLMVPDFYGGSSTKSFLEDKSSATYEALVNSGNNELANNLANYSSAYWGPQDFTIGSYYAGATIIFLFVVGILFADKKYVWWLGSLSLLSLMLSWGDSFSTFNYFMFDYFPGYNKFRSFNFALVMILLSMPLLGLMGVEKLLTNGISKESKKKLLIALGLTGGVCIALLVFAGLGTYMKAGEEQLPVWFTKALSADRMSLLRSDAFRSLAFILSIFVILYFNVSKKVSEIGFYVFLILIVTLDIAIVDKRYITKENFQRKRDNSFLANTPADEAILKDKNYYRVYNLRGAMNEARTSHSHYSLGGYHGAKLRRYQDLYDSCISKETQKLFADAQTGQLSFQKYGVLNMLNTKYVVYGPEINNILLNLNANGAAWFVKEVVPVNSPTEELQKLGEVNTRNVAVVDNSKFKVTSVEYDSLATILLKEFTPPYIKYESQSNVNGLAVFSEIYYPKGWHATIDGKEAEILRANYVLRALNIPAGKHTIEFTFKPEVYYIGNKITQASSWIMILVFVGSIAWSLRKED